MNQSGQAVLEYVFLLLIVVSLFMFAMNILQQYNVLAALSKPLTQDYAYSYRYGHPTARGPQEGGPTAMALDPLGGPTNFRIFMNPPISKGAPAGRDE